MHAHGTILSLNYLGCKNYQLAIKYFTKAAFLNHSDSQERLCSIYRHLEWDVKAISWCHVAHKNKNVTASEKMEFYKKQYIGTAYEDVYNLAIDSGESLFTEILQRN